MRWRSGGTPSPSSNLKSYVTRIRASKALTTFAAKNRPGLVQKKGERVSMKSKHVFAWDSLDSPRVSAKAETQQFRRRSHQLVPSRHDLISLHFTELQKPKPVEFMGFRVYFFIHVNRMDRKRQECASWDGHSVGKCEGT